MKFQKLFENRTRGLVQIRAMRGSKLLSILFSFQGEIEFLASTNTMAMMFF